MKSQETLTIEQEEKGLNSAMMPRRQRLENNPQGTGLDQLYKTLKNHGVTDIYLETP